MTPFVLNIKEGLKTGGKLGIYREITHGVVALGRSNIFI